MRFHDVSRMRVRARRLQPDPSRVRLRLGALGEHAAILRDNNFTIDWSRSITQTGFLSESHRVAQRHQERYDHHVWPGQYRHHRLGCCNFGNSPDDRVGASCLGAEAGRRQRRHACHRRSGTGRRPGLPGPAVADAGTDRRGGLRSAVRAAGGDVGAGRPFGGLPVRRGILRGDRVPGHVAGRPRQRAGGRRVPQATRQERRRQDRLPDRRRGRHVAWSGWVCWVSVWRC